jgi:uncharacterized protein YbjT (DUF2867 family)
LADPAPHAGKSYDLFGPKILDMTEVAAIFSDALGRKITYVPVDTETFAGIVKTAMNAEPYFVQHVSSLGQDLKDGRTAGMNDLVETLTGQKPMGMLEFINRNKIAFA